MPELTPQQIAQSIKRAEAMIHSERRLSKVKRHNESTPSLIGHFQENMGSHLGSILDDSLAESLLPQARNIVSMREERERFLTDETLLGRLKTTLDDFGMGGFPVEEGDIEATEKQMIASNDALINAFSDALENAGGMALFFILLPIIERAIQELVHAQLPLNAPPYDLSAI